MAGIESGKSKIEPIKESGKLSVATLAVLATIFAVSVSARAAINGCNSELCPAPKNTNVPSQLPEKGKSPFRFPEDRGEAVLPKQLREVLADMNRGGCFDDGSETWREKGRGAVSTKTTPRGRSGKAAIFFRTR